MITLNDYLYSGDTIFRILRNYTVDLKKEAKKKEQMMSELAVGDTVLTTSGFYGIVIDVSEDDTVIVEFGSNRNCRIPMQKAAIAAIEKPEEAVEAKVAAPDVLFIIS